MESDSTNCPVTGSEVESGVRYVPWYFSNELLATVSGSCNGFSPNLSLHMGSQLHSQKDIRWCHARGHNVKVLLLAWCCVLCYRLWRQL